LRVLGFGFFVGDVESGVGLGHFGQGHWAPTSKGIFDSSVETRLK